MPREDSAIPLKVNHFELNVNVRDAFTGNRYTSGQKISLLNLAPIALFGENRLKNSSG